MSRLRQRLRPHPFEELNAKGDGATASCSALGSILLHVARITNAGKRLAGRVEHESQLRDSPSPTLRRTSGFGIRLRDGRAACYNSAGPTRPPRTSAEGGRSRARILSDCRIASSY